MGLVRVPIANTIGKTVRINPDATVGATIGVDLKLPDGTVPSLAELATALASEVVAVAQVRSFTQLVDSIAPAQVPVGAVTQHQAALTILEAQITDGSILARVASVETISGQWDFTRSRGAPAQYAISVVSAAPFQEFDNTASGVNAGSWAWGALASSFVFRTTDDSDATGTTWLTVNRTAAVVDNATFGVPILATSFGGITSANLVDKAATESIAGGWTFTASEGVIISNTNPELHLRETDATVDEKNWIIGATGGNLKIQPASDATPETGVGAFVTFLRTGTNADEVRLKSDILSVRGGGTLKLHDSSNVDDVSFSHDGIDFNMVGTFTTDWNITGIAAIKAGTVDADFDAITATSYGGITEANLLDKTADETVSGSWIFTGTDAVPAASQSRLSRSRLYLDGKTVINGDDTFLRLNPGGAFTSGIFTSGDFRCDGAIVSNGYVQLNRTTTAALEAVGNAINTSGGKVDGAMVWNLTTNRVCFANGSADADVWLDGQGNTLHTPV